MSRGFVGDRAQEHPSSELDSTIETLSESDPTREIVGEIDVTSEAKSDAQLTAEIERLLSDRATVSAWMREPDYVESATLEWFTAWLNRRPLKASS